MILHPIYFTFFFINDTATTEIYTLSLHDALPISVKYPAPFGAVFGRKDLVEQFYQFQRPRMAVGLCGKSRIADEIFALQAARERRPLPVFVEQREDQPAAVLASVVIGDCVQRVLARTPLAEFRANQFGLGEDAVGPTAVGHQVRTDMPTLAGALAPVER